MTYVYNIPVAWFTCSALKASDCKIRALFFPSATLISASRIPKIINEDLSLQPGIDFNYNYHSFNYNGLSLNEKLNFTGVEHNLYK